MNEEKETLVVDRNRKAYAFFLGSEQQGNWTGFVNDQEPARLANELDVELVEK